jgi:hypothetical protein
VKLYELFSDVDTPLSRQLLEGLQVSSGKVVVRVCWVGKRLGNLIQSPCITLKILLVFGVYSTKLSVQCFFKE